MYNIEYSLSSFWTTYIIPVTPTSGVYLSVGPVYQSLCFLSWFHWWGLLITRKLLNQGSYWLSCSHHFKRFAVAIMTWLTVMRYVCHTWPMICSTCRNYNAVLFLFMTYQQVCNKSNTTSVTSGAGTTSPFGAHNSPEILAAFALLNLTFSD
jgi:hypothetical protein